MKKRRNLLPDAADHIVKDFFRKITSIRPEKRYHGKRLMTMSLRCAYNKFLSDNPGVRCSWGKFVYLRPEDVILLNRQHLLSCKYPYCQNVEFILQSINKRIALLQFDAAEKDALKLNSVYDVLNAVMCPKSSHLHTMECINSTIE